MTAIAAAYDYTKACFVMAADGRCTTMGNSISIKSDCMQKIFNFQSKQIAVMYSLMGFAGNEESGFVTTNEITNQLLNLSKRKYGTSNDLIDKLAFNIKKTIERGFATGKIIKPDDHIDLPKEEKGRFLRVAIMGFLKSKPFMNVFSLYVNPVNYEINVHSRPFDTSSFSMFCLGSYKIGEMLFGNMPIDPNLKKYLSPSDSSADPLTITTNYIKACSDPVALHIDPWCHIVGGHIHAAQLTEKAFNWLISPM